MENPNVELSSMNCKVCTVTRWLGYLKKCWWWLMERIFLSTYQIRASILFGMMLQLGLPRHNISLHMSYDLIKVSVKHYTVTPFIRLVTTELQMTEWKTVWTEWKTNSAQSALAPVLYPPPSLHSQIGWLRNFRFRNFAKFVTKI